MKPFPKAAAPTEAVIYCLVSSTKQTKAGDGLRSQETRCREYARYKGYAVIGAFHDDVSGGRLDRPGIKALLSFVRKHRASGIAIIIDDLSRLARDIRVHQDLREPIASAGGQLESPSIEFGDGPGSIFQENLMA